MYQIQLIKGGFHTAPNSMKVADWCADMQKCPELQKFKTINDIPDDILNQYWDTRDASVLKMHSCESTVVKPGFVLKKREMHIDDGSKSVLFNLFIIPGSMIPEGSIFVYNIFRDTSSPEYIIIDEDESSIVACQHFVPFMIITISKKDLGKPYIDVDLHDDCLHHDCLYAMFRDHSVNYEVKMKFSRSKKQIMGKFLSKHYFMLKREVDYAFKMYHSSVQLVYIADNISDELSDECVSQIPSMEYMSDYKDLMCVVDRMYSLLTKHKLFVDEDKIDAEFPSHNFPSEFDILG